MSELQKRILIVDDESSIGELLSEFCRFFGFETRILNSGKDVLKVAKIFRPNIITLDLVMPGISGLDVLEMIRNDEETKHIPVLIVSSVAKDQGMKNLLAHCQGILEKPFKANALKDQIDHAIPLNV